MRRWAFVLHFYQPGTQEPAITGEVLNKCYLPLAEALEQRPGVRVTMNLTGSLVEQLAGLRRQGDEAAARFLEAAGEMVRRGQAELVNTPMHHPVIPITPASVWVRQVEANKQILEAGLGVRLGNGFFPPELGVDDESVKKIRELGYGRIVTDGDQDHEICEVVRAYPGKLSGERLGEWIKKKYASGETFMSAHDAEVFGHHYEERLEVLKQLWDDGDFEFVKLEETRAGSEKDIKAGSWQNEPGWDLWAGNELQKKYLELGRMAAGSYEEFGPKTEGHVRESAREHLDLGWSSCHLYWLSNRPWWHPGLAERGANNLIKCIRSLLIDFKQKAEAEQMYHALLTQMWLMHWEGKQDEGFRDYDRKRQKLLERLPDLG